jgi:hypothetical protein
VGRSMAKARPLRKTSRKSGGKSGKEPRISAEVKRTAAAKVPPKPVDRLAKPVLVRPSRKTAAPPERPLAAPEIPPPLPAPIASFTF